ncbi:sulfurtransferase TusA family protein [Streptomyces sp. NPDC058695]|uniref:sulfurtransferase TusA family protein n=1 Tax=Streptomyces sp. NPDC058695 TaxID=3346604 RepID=UPI00364B282C
MSAQHPAAAVVVEAGGEPWSRVEPLLDRRSQEMADHGVLEVVTANPGVRTAISGWCTRKGRVVEATADRNGSTSFRIRIGSPSLPEVP